MRKTPLQIGVFVCAAGAFGVFFRWLQLQLAFDNGLAGPSLWNFVVPLSILAVAWLFRRFVEQYRDERCHLPTEFHAALKNDLLLYRMVRIAIGAVMCLGALLLFAGAETDPNTVFLRVIAAAGLLTGLSWMLLLREANREPGESRVWLLCLYSLIPVLFFVVLLVYDYKANSLNSVIWAYVIEILTVCVSILAFFRVAGFAFGQPNAEKAMRLCMLGAFLCFMSLADERKTGLQIMFFACAMQQVLYAWIMVANLEQGEAPPPPEQPSDGFERL
ncbi:MAG: hypothetical protein IJJ43_02415 [Oscillospiraceae bacterium]|nr:hypothetical protein [Oscillospiraceae bacterium]